MKRAVLDTNVMLASQKTASAHSPNAEIVRRWKAGEFTLLITDDLLQEYAEKLIEKGIEPALRRMLLRDLILLGEQVAIAFFHLRHYPVDPDDTPFLLAALNGNATHLVTSDQHLEDVGIFYPEFITCRPRIFLQDLRLAAHP
jgi:putative PIN family toxin of toxin-antitoxin system